MPIVSTKGKDEKRKKNEEKIYGITVIKYDIKQGC